MTNMVSILAVSFFTVSFAYIAHGQNSHAIPAGIENLHKADVAATVARDADALTALWDDDAVLLQPGSPPIIGKVAFHEFMKQALAKSSSVQVVKYVPDIRDVQVAGDVAYEWGYFDAAQKSPGQHEPVNLRAKLLRVMKRQLDGSWKFTRVMWLPD